MSEQDPQRILTKVLQTEADTLRGIIRSYALRMGAASAAEATTVADEILSETTTAAMEAADKFDTSRRPIPWLLGIALNRIRRRVRQQQQQRQREINVRDMYPSTQADCSDDELFDQFSAWARQPSQLELRQQLAPLLATLSDDDNRLLQLSVVEELDSQRVAAELGMTAVTVRVRLHRILKRLRRQAHLHKREGSNT